MNGRQAQRNGSPAAPSMPAKSETRTEALAIKKGLSKNSPNSEKYAFSEFLVAKENELRELADKLVK